MKYVDAEELAAVLKKKHPNSKGLLKRVLRVKALRSIRRDLMQAMHAVHMLQKIAKERDKRAPTKLSSEEGTIDASLAMFAIVTYSKCTDTSSSRGKFDPRRFFDDVQKRWHKEIIMLRNNSAAHFGSGNHIAGHWAKDVLMMGYDPMGHAIEVKARNIRANYRGLVIAQLEILLPIALAGVDEDIELSERPLALEILDIPEIAAVFRDLPAAEEPRGDQYEPTYIKRMEDGDLVPYDTSADNPRAGC